MQPLSARHYSRRHIHERCCRVVAVVVYTELNRSAYLSVWNLLCYLQRGVSSLTWLTLRASLTGILVTVLLLVSLVSSVFWYTFFYSLFIPQLSLSLPVTFDFSQPHPTASVSLISPQWSYSSLPSLLSLSASTTSPTALQIATVSTAVVRRHTDGYTARYSK